jgi:methyl coenzyme M reductase subunit C
MQCAGKSDRFFDLSYGFRAVHLGSSENHSCMKFVAKDFNCPNVVTCFKTVKYETVFENGINARFLVQLTQYTVIVF